MRAAWLYGLGGLALGLAAGAAWTRGGADPVSPESRAGLERRIAEAESAHRAATRRASALAGEAAALRKDLEAVRAGEARKDLQLREQQTAMGGLETEAARLRAALAEARSGDPAPPGPEEAARRGRDAKARFEEALARKDGRGVLEALRALLKLGPPGYPLAAGLWLRIHEDFQGGNALKLSTPQYYESLGDLGFMQWALKDPSVDRRVRLQALGGMPWVDPEGASAFITSLLAAEQDPLVLMHMAQELGSLARPGTERDLLAMAQRQGLDPKARAEFVTALGGFPGPEVSAALAAFASDPEPDVREAARIAGVMQSPPAPGIVLTAVTPESQAEAAGLARGDLLVSYDQKPVVSWDDLVSRIRAADPAQDVQVQFFRDGGMRTLTLKGGRMGITGDFVQPR